MRQSERLGQAGFAQHCIGGVSALLPPLPLAGEGWGEGQCVLNGLQNAFAIRHHLVVPEAHNAPSVSLEKSVASNVDFAVRVLSAVELDDEVMFDRSEIGDERADRHLPTKFYATKTAIAEQSPHDPLSLSCVAAKDAGKISLLPFPHVLPSPGRYAATLSRKRARE